MTRKKAEKHWILAPHLDVDAPPQGIHGTHANAYKDVDPHLHIGRDGGVEGVDAGAVIGDEVEVGIGLAVDLEAEVGRGPAVGPSLRGEAVGGEPQGNAEERVANHRVIVKD